MHNVSVRHFNLFIKIQILMQSILQCQDVYLLFEDVHYDDELLQKAQGNFQRDLSSLEFHNSFKSSNS